MDPIDLRPKKQEDYSSPAIGSCNSHECPYVYLNGPKELADLPKEGLVTFEFKRSELTLTDGEDQPVRLVLKLKAIVDAEQGAEESDDVEDEDVDDESGDALDKKFRKASSEDEVE